jgi:phage terminase large subunit-like protein
MSDIHQISPREAVELGAVDSRFYSQYFFPKAFRQSSPAFHEAIWKDLEDPKARYVAIEVFRGGAKTTLLRCFTSKRIAYGLSRTILFVSEAQNHSVRSVEWLRRNVKYNKLWAGMFGLEIGGKESAEELEIINTVDGSQIRIIALGITGQTRGVNVDDFRPDLIVVDDPCDEENTGTPEQRKKISDLFFGALARSLAPASESPHALMALLQTPLNGQDLIECALRDPQWVGHRYGCFTEDGESRWPERWSTETLLEEKEAHIARNQTALWLREMECRIVSEETSSFRHEWLEYWDVLPEHGVNVMAIDPVPPPSESQVRKNLDTDWEVIHVWKEYQGKRYLCERVANRGHDPEWTIAEVFRLAIKWHVFKIGVEAIAYQRTLAWLLRKAMQAKRTYFAVEEISDRRKKRHRIEQSFSGRGSQHLIHIHPSMTPFIEQWDAYPDVNHDDELDCGAMANVLLDNIGFIGDADFEEIEDDLPSLAYMRGAP